MTTDSQNEASARQAALNLLTRSAAENVAGADHVSITVRHGDGPLRTVAATDPLAERADSLQYDFREGPCYAAVTDERFVLVNDMAATDKFPRYAPAATALGIGAQAAVQLVHDGDTAALNLYALHTDAFDRSTVQIAELFANQAGALLGYATQVEQLSQALHTRTDIATAVGILMERYQIDRDRAFAFLARTSQDRNIKLRLVAQQVIDKTFLSTAGEDEASGKWP